MLPAEPVRRHILLLLLLFLAAASRFYGLDRLGLWADELWVVMDSSSGSLWELLRTIHFQDNHPPGYYLLSRVSQQLLGSSDFAIRLPSALAGIALVWATFSFGQTFFSAKAGAIAAALVTGSWQAIYFSQEARPNIFLALFCLLSLQAFLLALQAQRSTPSWPWAFWLWTTLAAYFHYAGLVFAASLGVVWMGYAALQHQRATWLAGLKLFLPLLLLYLPWLPSLYHDLSASPAEAWQRTPELQTLLKTFLFLFGPGDLRVLFHGVALSIATAATLWIAMRPTMRGSRQGHAALCLWLAMLLPVAFFYFKSAVSQSAYNHRHFLFVIPFLSLLAGAGLAEILSRLFRQRASLALALTLALILSYQAVANWQYGLYRANHFKQDYRECVHLLLEANRQSSAPALLASNVRFFDHYLKRMDHRPTDVLVTDSSQLPLLATRLQQQATTQFYLLEEPLIPAANRMVTDLDRALASSYRPFCRSKLQRTQLIGFIASAEPGLGFSGWEELPRCEETMQTSR